MTMELITLIPTQNYLINIKYPVPQEHKRVIKRFDNNDYPRR